MLTKEDVSKIAVLSKLYFSDEELVDMHSDLSMIFTYVEQLNEVDTTDVLPLYNVLDLKDQTREDCAEIKENKQQLLENAPKKDENFIIVPKMVGE